MIAGSSKTFVLAAFSLVGAATMVILKLGSGAPPSSSPDSPTRVPDASSTTTTRPFHIRYSAKGREALTITAKLAPDIKILEGTPHGEVLQGPVKIAGVLPPSELQPSGEPDESGFQSYRVAPVEHGEFQGDFTVQASSARATRNGIHFQGPILFSYQNTAGKTYEVFLESKDSFFFLSADGLRQVFATSGAFQIRHAPLGLLSR